jgi:hypothetical protein
MTQLQPEPNPGILTKLLQENQRLLEENNRLLIQMRRRAQFAFIGGILRIAIWVGIFAFIYMQYVLPQLETLQSFYESLQGLREQSSAVEAWLQSVSDSPSNSEEPRS